MAYAGKLTYKTELDTSGVEKAGSTVKSIIAGLGITKMITTAINQITQSIDGAIARYDTLNNFPKVMSNLGIASEDADKSIKKMSDRLSGLPTTLDQGALAVQRFTSANSDVEKSTDIFLALNNAILAGGASSEIQTSALEQLSQAYAKGKPDMMEWRTAMTAMPAQLKQVATAMGYVSADELGESLRKGIVSMDEFMDTIVQLNEEGIDGFNNFEEQARNATGGIATAITVAKTQVVKGVTDLIDGINKGLADADLPSVSEIIAMIGQKAKEVLDVIASKLPSVINFMVKLFKTIKPFIPFIEAFGAEIIAIVTAYTLYQKVVKIVTAVQTALNLVMAMNPIGLIVLAIVGLIAAFVVLWNKCEWFRNFWIGFWDAIVSIVVFAWNWIKGIFDAVISFVRDNWVAILMFLVNPFVGAFKLLYDNCEAFRNFVDGFIQGVIEFFQKLPSNISNIAQKIVDTIANLPQKMIDFGINIAKGIGDGITKGVDWVKGKVEEFKDKVTGYFTDFFQIGSPSKLLKKLVGIQIPAGVAVGVEENTDSIEDAMNNMYKDINKTIKMENAKLSFDVISGNVYNKSFYQTPIEIDVNADVEMDSQKVGRLVTPSVTRTIKNGGGV